MDGLLGAKIEHAVEKMGMAGRLSARAAAAGAVGALGPAANRETVPALIEALQDEEKGVRITAALVLGSLGPAAKDAVPALIQALEDRGISGKVAEALGKMGPTAREARPRLVEMLEAGLINDRGRALRALLRIPSDD